MGISRGFGLIAGIISSTATGFLISQVGQFLERLQVAGIVLGPGTHGGGSPGRCVQAWVRRIIPAKYDSRYVERPIEGVLALMSTTKTS